MGHVLSGDTSVFAAYSLFATDGADTSTPLLIAFGVIAVKAFACASTNSGGGVAGDFAPTLMAGCVTGYLVGAVLNLIFGLSLPVSTFAFIGMAGVMAGAVRAPFMAIFITVEMTQTYTLLLPVVAAAAISYLCTLLLHKLFHRPTALPGTY